MTWVNLSAAFAFESQLTSTQMQNLRDNIAAAFAKDSGAPVLAASYVNSSMVGGNILDQNHMNASLETVTHTFQPSTAYAMRMVFVNGLLAASSSWDDSGGP